MGRQRPQALAGESLRLDLAESVIQRFEGDPEFFSGEWFIAVVFVERSQDHFLFHLPKCAWFAGEWCSRSGVVMSCVAVLGVAWSEGPSVGEVAAGGWSFLDTSREIFWSNGLSI